MTNATPNVAAISAIAGCSGYIERSSAKHSESSISAIPPFAPEALCREIAPTGGRKTSCSACAGSGQSIVVAEFIDRRYGQRRDSRG